MCSYKSSRTAARSVCPDREVLLDCIPISASSTETPFTRDRIRVISIGHFTVTFTLTTFYMVRFN